MGTFLRVGWNSGSFTSNDGGPLSAYTVNMKAGIFQRFHMVFLVLHVKIRISYTFVSLRNENDLLKKSMRKLILLCPLSQFEELCPKNLGIHGF